MYELKGKLFLIMLAFLIPFAIYMEYYGPTQEEQISIKAREITKTCPSKIDDYTRLDSTHHISTLTLEYYLSLTEITSDEVDTIRAHRMMDNFLVNFTKKHQGHDRFFGSRDVFISYYCRDKKGKYLMRLEISPKEYLIQYQ